MKTIEYDNNGNAIPPIGLKPADDVDDKDAEVTTFEWKDSAGNQVKKNVVVFRKGSVELLIRWRESMHQLLADQGVTAKQDIINAHNRVLGNPSKNVYNNGVQQFKNTEDARVATARLTTPNKQQNYNGAHEAGLACIAIITIPSEAYTVQRNWLQLHVRKPIDMTVRNFQFQIEKINLMMAMFPPEA